MSWWRQLFGLQKTNNARIIHMYARCHRCQSPVQVRLDVHNDLAIEYNERGDILGYVVRKELMDAKCFRLMRAELWFDAQRNETQRTLEGGDFIDVATYTQLTTGSSHNRADT
ncbi:MAG: hypothetical protein FJ040_01520 [Chloroflexi bacterium]|nr:hypothetical protein [Chloroflexota bacterium]